jgi:hypothetical protein
MPRTALKPTFLVGLAAEAVAPVLGACPGDAGEAARRWRDLIAAAWLEWFSDASPALARAVLERLAALPADEARRAAADALDRLAPHAGAAGRAPALDYLARLPAAVRVGLLTAGDAVDSLDGVCHLLPDPAAQGGPTAARPAEAVQQRPVPPPPAPLPADLAVPDGAALASLRRSDLTTKLRLLVRCHDMEARALMRRRFQKAGVFLLVLLGGGVFGGLAGAGVYMSVYDPPTRYARSYDNYPAAPTYYVSGAQVSQQEYDAFLARHDSKEVLAGLAVLGVLLLLAWSFYLRRPGPPASPLEEQAAAVLAAHPAEVASWGGPAVLRRRELVEELLRLAEREGR